METTKNTTPLKIPKQNKWIIVIAFFGSLSAVILFGFGLYFMLTLHSRWNASMDHYYQIDSFAGCGRDNNDSYKYKTSEEIDEILKMWDVSEKEFEKRKKKCQEKL